MHVTYILSICSQRIFLLKRLRDQWLLVHYLDLVFHAIVACSWLNSRKYLTFSMLSLYGDHVCLLNKSIELILSSKDHIAVALLSKLMTLLLWLITPVRICLVKQWPHITVYTACYRHRRRISTTFAPAGTIFLSPSSNIMCIGILFSQISFWVCLTVFIHCLAFAVMSVSLWFVNMHVWCIFH